jgi:hypothetical protein
MVVTETHQSRLRIGDLVEWVSAAESVYPAAGVIVASWRQAGVRDGDSEYVVQVTPTILGIYRAAELTHIGREQPEEFWEMLVP